MLLANPGYVNKEEFAEVFGAISMKEALM